MEVWDCFFAQNLGRESDITPYSSNSSSFTSILPKFSPLNRPLNASGARSPFRAGQAQESLLIYLSRKVGRFVLTLKYRATYLGSGQGAHMTIKYSPQWSDCNPTTAKALRSLPVSEVW